MADSWIALLVTGSYLLVALGVGLFSAGRTSAGTVGYVSGDRALGVLVLYFVMGASIFSAFAFLGGPGWAYSRGAAAFYIIAYGTIGLIPWYFLGPRIAALGRRFGYVTQAELFAHRYQSKTLSVLLAIISIVAFIPYLTLQMEGAGYVLSVVSENRIPAWAGAAIAYGVVLTYVFRSGMMGVAWTNVFQGLFMMGLAWGLGLYLPYKLYGSVSEMFAQLEAARPEMLVPPGLGADGNPWTWGAYSSAIAISALGFSIWPHYFMKIYTASSVRTLKLTVVLYPTFQVFLLPILFIGFSGILSRPGVSSPDTILPLLVTSLELSPFVVGLFCAGALAASMSTGDALAHAGGSIIVRDFLKIIWGRSWDGQREVTLIRVSIIFIGAISYFFAVFSDRSLVFLLLLSYGAISQLFPALLAALLWPRSTKAGVISGLVSGSVITAIFNLVPDLQWQGIHPGIWGLACNVVILIAVSLATRPEEPGHIRQFQLEEDQDGTS